MYHAGPGSASPTRFTALGAFGIVCIAAGTLLVCAIVVTAAGVPIMTATILIQSSMLLVAIVAMAQSGRTPAALGWRRPRLRYVVAAVLIGVSAWYLNLRLVELLGLDKPDPETTKLLERPSVVMVLIAIAFAPAVCEEVLFRGVLARGLASQLKPWVAIGLSALIFSAYHVRPEQMPATFTLGIVFAWLALKADSAVPTMIAHLLNNTIALLIMRRDLPDLAATLALNPVPTLAGCVVLTAGGIALAARGRIT